MANDDRFEGSTHVLKGLAQQLSYWQSMEGHDAEKQIMVPALTQAVDALKGALKRAKGG
ncbi:MAG TPA: hypothetical protein VHE77_07125 [Dongiaceae bacterium]|jgi:hypothetical protein|nr:hypothetical protein [Dongiaceae bacterium]